MDRYSTNSAANNSSKRFDSSNIGISTVGYRHHQSKYHHHNSNINKNMSLGISSDSDTGDITASTNTITLHPPPYPPPTLNLNRNSFPDLNNVSFSSSVSGSIQDDLDVDNDCSLSEAGLEEYSTAYYEHNPIVILHQKQSSYAQSEGYHSYVSSSDSSSTPFLDRLRQDSDALLSRASQWSQDIQAAAEAVNSTSENNSSESTSSTETLKWHGSMSDVSVASHSTNTSNISGSVSSSQLIAHSSRVRTPKRHNSESVLYISDEKVNVSTSSQCGSTDTLNKISANQNSSSRSNRSNSRLFAVSTYTESSPTSPSDTSSSKIQNNQNWQSVAERISELERQHSTSNQCNEKFTYLDPSKQHRVSNPTLKAFQKNAVQSYFARQQSFKEHAGNGNTIKRNNIITNGSSKSISIRPQSLQLNTSSSASKLHSRSSLPDNFKSNSGYYQHVINLSTISSSSTSSNNISSNNNNTSMSPSNTSKSRKHNKSPTSQQSQEDAYHNTMEFAFSNDNTSPPPPPPRNRTSLPARRTLSASEYASFHDQGNLICKQNLSKDLLQPMIMGPIISVDDWVPERPPKNPMLRIPSPELPPPPLNTIEAEVQLLNQDEPLPPPPPELLRHLRQLSEPDTKPAPSCRRNSFAGQTNKKSLYRASTFENLSPPIIAAKPTLHSSTTTSSPPVFPQRPSFGSKHNSHKAQSQSPSVIMPNRINDARLSIRKRTHNSQTTIELATVPIKAHITSPPPPLKPKMSVFSSDFKFYNNGVSRVASKSSSYHPRLAFEKQQSLVDLDQGTYKPISSPLKTDIIRKIPSTILLQPNQHELKSNLPDVLPVDAKAISASQACSSEPVSEQLKKIESNFDISTPASSEASPVHNISPKYKSHSSFDLKKVQVLDKLQSDVIKLSQQPIDFYSGSEDILNNNKIENDGAVNSVEEMINQFTDLDIKNIEDNSVVSKEIPAITNLEFQTSSPRSSSPITVTKLLSEISIPHEHVRQKSEETPKILQKTEIVLRLNAPTSEAASQTEGDLDFDDTIEADFNDNKSKLVKNGLNARQKLPEEIECDKLSKDLVSHLLPTDKLYNILVPTVRKSSLDYVSDLYNPNISPRPTRKDASTTTTIEILVPSHNRSIHNPFDASFANANNAYFGISSPNINNKLHRYSREMTLINGETCDLMKKKEELLIRLSKKLAVLAHEQTNVAEESVANDMLGNSITAKVELKLKPTDVSKMRSFIDDVGHITMLLLSLSSRLAKIENMIHSTSDIISERKNYESKRDRLLEQLDEAKRLKEDINRRGTILSSILEKHLTEEEISDYDYFINLKAKLLVDYREITDKIKLGEEQIVALKDTMVQSEC